MLSSLRVLYARDIATLQTEVDLYPGDDLLWQDVAGCPNCGGTLVLHLIGNLRHFIGAQLGGTGYVRDRDAEFSTRGLNRSQLQDGISRASADVAKTLSSLDPTRLNEPFLLPAHGKSVVTGLFLLHLSTHLAFHLGQLDYHRRTVTGDRQGAGAVPLSALFSS